MSNKRTSRDVTNGKHHFTYYSSQAIAKCKMNNSLHLNVVLQVAKKLEKKFKLELMQLL